MRTYARRNRRRKTHSAVFLMLITLIAGGIGSFGRPAVALSNNFILGDEELFSGTAMSAARVQQFLTLQGGYLASYTINDGTTTNRAADIIAEVSRTYDLNPKFFLTMLEKEMSLITDKSPTQRQLDYALSFGCPSTCSSAYKGFATQLRSAAARIREDYIPALQQKGQFNGWGPGITKTTVDGISVTPTNIATAVLYIYNPYVGKYGGGDQRWGANSLFQILWHKWFVSKHPDGSLLQVIGEPGIWLINNGRKSAFKSRIAFTANYSSAKVIKVTLDEIETYPDGPSILFPEPSLVQMRKGGGIYLIANGQKRSLASKEVLQQIGYLPEQIIRKVNDADVEFFPTGPKVTLEDLYPTGRLLQSKTNGGIVYVDSSNVRHAIFSRAILKSQFGSQIATKVTEGELASYAVGDPVKFRDGELIGSRTEKRIYVVSNGQRRWIQSLESFKELGFKLSNVIWTDDRSLEVQPVGEPLNDYNATALRH